MASQKVPLFIYAECILAAASTHELPLLCRTTRRRIDEYIVARGRTKSYYALPLDSVLDKGAASPSDIDTLHWRNLRHMRVNETVESLGQIYHPTAWIRRNKRWIPFEFVNLGLWEAMWRNTDELRTVAKGFLMGVAELIDGTPLEETLVVRRAELAGYPWGTELGAFPSAEEVSQGRSKLPRWQDHRCVTM